MLFTVRRKGVLVFVCEIEGGKRRIPLPQSWTDRGPEAQLVRFAVDGLAAARALIDAMASPPGDDTGVEE